MNRHEVTTFLTMVIVGLWVVTAAVRIWVDLPPAGVLDSLMPLVVGYWFASKAADDKKDGVAA